MNLNTEEFDNDLKKIPHYVKYPQMLPFVGRHFNDSTHQRVLVIAESHYFPKGEALMDAGAWYGGTSETLTPSQQEYTYTRGVIDCGKNQRWKSKGHRMFANMEREMISGGLPKEENAFVHVAFMNCFQRPARNKQGFSKIAEPKDVEVAAETVRQVIEIIQPERVCFVSAYAWKWLSASVFTPNIAFEHTAHPSNACWYRNTKGGRARQIFQQFISGSLKGADIKN